MTKLDEIYEAVLPEMEANGIEDTPENRYSFLSGLRDSWMEDTSRSVEKSLYLWTLNVEILRLKVRMLKK